MSAERKYEAIKESKGWYFIEYHPPNTGAKYANLQLVITIENAAKIDIMYAMEKELKDWLNRYPIPLFISVFDNKGHLYDFEETEKHKYLFGYFNGDGNIGLYQRLLENEEIPDIALNQKYVDDLYSNLSFTTNAELDMDRRKRRRQIETGWFIFFIWLAVIPFVTEIFIYFNKLLSLVAFLYILYKAIQKVLEFVHMWPKSKREKERELEETLKRHYYYHCQMNPEGFKRLMQENNTKMIKDDIAKEAESLKK